MKPIEIIFNYQVKMIKQNALEYLFGHKLKNIYDQNIVLMGAGSLGRDLKFFLNSFDIFPISFCDTNPKEKYYCDIPIISIDELISLNNPLVVISSKAYATDLKLLLINYNFPMENIIYPNDFDDIKMSYFTKLNAEAVIRKFSMNDDNDVKFKYLKSHEDKINRVYDILADEKSKKLFISRLATQLNWDCINCYSSFLREFSEPIKLFGTFQGYLTPSHKLLSLGDGIENYFYFNNDIIILENNKTYVDIGAYNGDSIRSLIQSLKNKKLNYKEIIAFEPDSNSYEVLINTIPKLDSIIVNKSGLSDFTGKHKFHTAEEHALPGSAYLSLEGDVEINVIKLDDYLAGKRVDFIKMDAPRGGHAALKGAAKTISRFSPTLAFAAYHEWNDVFEIPYLISEINPSYNIYLRHTAFLICETEVFAIK
jgi:FkbM family methyltransferase